MLNSCQPCDGIIPWTSVNCCALPLLWAQHQGSALLNNASAAEQARGGKPTSSQQIIFTQERSGHGLKAGQVHSRLQTTSFSQLCYFHAREPTSDDLGAFLADLYQYQQRAIQACGVGDLWDKVCSTEATMVKCERINPPNKAPVGQLLSSVTALRAPTYSLTELSRLAIFPGVY